LYYNYRAVLYEDYYHINLFYVQGSAKVDVALWREVAISKMDIGASVRVTHLKMGNSAFKDQLQSTIFSVLEVNFKL